MLNYVKIFEADNSKGTQDFTIVEDISQGITSANSKASSSEIESGAAMENTLSAGGAATISGGYGGAKASASVSYQETETTSADIAFQFGAEFSEQGEESRQKSVTTTFTAPAGKKYVVYQPTAVIKDYEDKDEKE